MEEAGRTAIRESSPAPKDASDSEGSEAAREAAQPAVPRTHRSITAPVLRLRPANLTYHPE
ncbi:conserved hypothetical protein [Stigmatella aurantiaca DW4/3-1]|uniref:Uncharacterized protein n=1 Tax=Stigmatella aurantiaca (strain DW4/3-1) TaxID=378806 RepID=Q08YA1_STIAD|nr:conserved hypothetical protein [Stigmatella aurantiaca DW4/3-1]